MVPSVSNLTESGTPSSVATTSGAGIRAIDVDSPDLVGVHHREVQQAVGPELHGVGRRHVLQDHPGCRAIQGELQQPAAVPALADEQPVIVDGDPVGGRHVVKATPDTPFSRALTRPFITSVAISAEEGDVIGSDDVAALGLMVSTDPVAMSRALIWLPVTCAMGTRPSGPVRRPLAPNATGWCSASGVQSAAVRGASAAT